MSDAELFNKFIGQMLKKIDEHQAVYGDSWKSMSTGMLYERLKSKMNEFDLTYNKDKLLSMSNLSMLLYIRMVMDREKKEKEEGEKDGHR